MIRSLPFGLGIRAIVLRRFENLGSAYVGLVKVKSIGTQCVRVQFDWAAIGGEPQDFILSIGNGAEVEVVGWAERKG